MKDKKKFEEPKATVIYFESDIIETSEPGPSSPMQEFYELPVFT